MSDKKTPKKQSDVSKDVADVMDNMAVGEINEENIAEVNSVDDQTTNEPEPVEVSEIITTTEDEPAVDPEPVDASIENTEELLQEVVEEVSADIKLDAKFEGMSTIDLLKNISEYLTDTTYATKSVRTRCVIEENIEKLNYCIQSLESK